MNNNSHNPFENFNYKLVSRCPMCSASASRAQVEMLDSNPDGSLMLYSRCGGCGVGLIACLSAVQGGMYGAAVLTDLQKNEVRHFAEELPLTADEVMDYVKDLKTHKRYKK